MNMYAENVLNGPYKLYGWRCRCVCIWMCSKMFHGQNVYSRAQTIMVMMMTTMVMVIHRRVRAAHTQTYNELNATGTFTWRNNIQFATIHVCGWKYSAHILHTTRQYDDGKTFGKWIFARAAIIILQEIEQFASLMVFDLDNNQASSVNNIYDWYEANNEHKWIQAIRWKLNLVILVQRLHTNMYGLELIWPEIIWNMSVTNWTCSSY